MLKQTFGYTLSSAIGRLLAFLLYVHAAERLGPEVFGRFGNMATYLMVLTILTTFGLDLWLARHAAKEALRAGDFWRIVRFRWLLCLTCLPLLALLWTSGWAGKAVEGFLPETMLLLASLLFDHVALSAQALLEGRGLLTRSAMLSLFRFTSLFLLGLALLGQEATLLNLNLAFLLSSLGRAVLSCLALRGLLEQGKGQLSTRTLVGGAGPMALLNALVALYFHIDMLMLPEMVDLRQTGWYKAAYSLVEACLFLSAGVASALYPLFSTPTLSKPAKVRQLKLALKWLHLLAFPLAFGGTAMAPHIVGWLFQKQAHAYTGTIVALQILVWALPFMFANNALVRFHLGLGNTLLVLRWVLAIALLNIALNAAMIPHWGFRGAGISTILSEGLLFLLLCQAVRREEAAFSPLPTFFLAALVGSLVWPLSFGLARLAPLLAIPLSALAYFLLLVFSGILKRQDWQLFGREP
jgi:O-antigen/teichoic acid export membrane protein